MFIWLTVLIVAFNSIHTAALTLIIETMTDPMEVMSRTIKLVKIQGFKDVAVAI